MKEKDIEILTLARKMHELYEQFSSEEKWETQERTKVDFDLLPKENRNVMIRLAESINTAIREDERAEVMKEFDAIKSEQLQDIVQLAREDERRRIGIDTCTWCGGIIYPKSQPLRDTEGETE